MKINNKGKMIIGVFSFFLLTPFIIYYLVTGGGFDTRSKAMSPGRISPGDIEVDQAVNMSDFSLWLSCFYNYKQNKILYKGADLNNDDAITLIDFGIWLQYFYTYKSSSIPSSTMYYEYSYNNGTWEYSLSVGTYGSCNELLHRADTLNSSEVVIYYVVKNANKLCPSHALPQTLKVDGTFSASSNQKISFIEKNVF